MDWLFGWRSALAVEPSVNPSEQVADTPSTGTERVDGPLRSPGDAPVFQDATMHGKPHATNPNSPDVEPKPDMNLGPGTTLDSSNHPNMPQELDENAKQSRSLSDDGGLSGGHKIPSTRLGPSRHTSEPEQEPANERAVVNEEQASQVVSEEQWDEWELEPEVGWDAFYRNQHPFLRNFQELNNSRSRLASVRLKLRELRKSLRVKRDAIDERENQLLQTMRKFFLFGGDRKDPSDLIWEQSQIQELRDRFREDEADYDGLEETLVTDEYQLRENERSLYLRAIGSAGHQPAESPRTPFRSRSASTSSSAIRHQDAMAVSGVTERWSARLRDRYRLQYRLDDLEAEYRNLFNEKQMREIVGRSLDEDSEDFLRNFPMRRAMMQEELAVLDDGIAKLEQAKEEQSDAFFSIHQFSGLGSEPTPCDLEELGPIEWAESDEPLFLPVKAILSVNMDATTAVGLTADLSVHPVTDPTIHYIDMETYINDWLLHKLRVSLLEIYRFRLQFVKTHHLKIDKKIFTKLVLTLWAKDGSFASYEHEQDGAVSFEAYFADSARVHPGAASGGTIVRSIRTERLNEDLPDRRTKRQSWSCTKSTFRAPIQGAPRSI